LLDILTREMSEANSSVKYKMRETKRKSKRNPPILAHKETARRGSDDQGLNVADLPQSLDDSPTQRNGTPKMENQRATLRGAASAHRPARDSS